MRFFSSIKFRIMLAVSIMLIIVFILLGQLLLSRIETRLIQAFDRNMRTRAEFLLSRVSINPRIIPIVNEDEKIVIISEYFNKAQEIYRSTNFPDSTKPAGRKFRYITVEDEDDNQESNTRLTLAYVNYQLLEDLEDLQILFISALIVSILMVFLGGYFVADWLLKPVNTITERVKKIVSTETIEPLPLPASNDELHALTVTINGMLDRIKENSIFQKNFFASAAHELRTPLAVMKTGIEVNMNNPDLQPNMKGYLREQLDDVNRLSRLLEDFMLISRSNSLSTTLIRDKINLHQLIEVVITKTKPVAFEYGAIIKVQPLFKEEYIYTDPLKIEHVLLNFLENAIKYAKPDTNIDFKIENLGGEGNCVFTVQNKTAQETGETQKLFQAYYQGDPFKDGHGLGLWISNRLAQMIGGNININWQNHNFKAQLILKV